jgi:mitosis inhibitor protein kinase SWE1
LSRIRGEAWHRLRREDFSQVDHGDSPKLLDLIRQMMRTDPSLRMSVHAICDHPVISRARVIMRRMYIAAKRDGTSLFAASPLASVHAGFLEEILDDGSSDESLAMDLSP